MILFFGFGHQTHKDIGPLNEELCPHCRQTHFRKLCKTKSWVTLFFVPTIPYKTEWVSRCTHCSGDVLIKESDRAFFQRLAQLNEDAIRENWSDEQYREEKSKRNL